MRLVPWVGDSKTQAAQQPRCFGNTGGIRKPTKETIAIGEVFGVAIGQAQRWTETRVGKANVAAKAKHRAEPKFHRTQAIFVLALHQPNRQPCLLRSLAKPGRLLPRKSPRLAATRGATVKLWSLDGQSLGAMLRPATLRDDAELLALAFSPDGRPNAAAPRQAT